MSFKKAVLPILSTFISAVLVCLYFFSIYRSYDGAINLSFIVWIFITPVFYIISLYNISKGKNKYVAQKKWQKISSLIILLMLVAFAVYSLIKNPYTLPAIMLIIFIPLAFILDIVQKKSGKKIVEFSVVESSLSVIGLYILAGLIVFVYIAVVNPLSVEEAKDTVAKLYPDENYEFGAYLNRIYDDGTSPLGVYFFSDMDSDDPIIEISVLDGKVV